MHLHQFVTLFRRPLTLFCRSLTSSHHHLSLLLRLYRLLITPIHLLILLMSFSTSLLPSNAVSYPFHAIPPPFSATRRLYLPLNASSCLLTPFSRSLVPLVSLLPPPHCLSTSLSRLLIRTSSLTCYAFSS